MAPEPAPGTLTALTTRLHHLQLQLCRKTSSAINPRTAAMNLTRRVRFLLSAIAAVIVLAGPGRALAQETTRTRDVVYGHKFGMALTLDVMKPAKPNGAGVIYMVSGGFNSDMAAMDGFFGPARIKPFLARGYTLFLVCHGSQPKFTVSEIVEDVHRSVRFIRAHAKDYGVDPDRLGITGTSSGGFLALTIATKGRPGNPEAKDAVDRASSQVRAVACFCPATDLIDYGKTGRSILEYEPAKFAWHVFGLDGKAREEQIKALRELSPLAFITKQTPPTLIIHGDADPLVPYEQSERFDAKLAEHGVAHRLETRKGAGHGWLSMGQDSSILADWFDKYLVPGADGKGTK
jgi:acetyl esterase/lipase